MPKKIDYASMFTLRADGRYQGYWHELVDGKPAGKRHTICDRDPEKLFSRIEAKEQPAEPTFADIAEAWHDKTWGTYKEGTHACYASNYKRALDEQDGRLAAEVTPSDIEDHLQALADRRLSAKTIKTTRTIYKLIYQNAIIDPYYSRWVHENPALNAPIPKAKVKAKKREAPEDEIVDAIRRSATSAYFGLYAMALISTGFRRGEALALTWGDIDYESKTVSCREQLLFRGTAHFGDTKTESAIRSVPLLPDFEKVLVRPDDAEDDQFIFQSEGGTHLSESTFRRKWNHYCKDMGFRRVKSEEPRVSKQGHKYVHVEYENTLTSHVLRHGYATMLYDAGVDVYTAKRLLGHANIETTLAIYTHLSRRKNNESIAKLTAYANNGYQTVENAGQ